MAIAYQHEPRQTASNEIAAFFLIGTPASVLMLALQDGIDQYSLQLTLKLLPGVLLGWGLSRLVDNRLNLTSARYALLAVSAISALWVIGEGVYQLWFMDSKALGTLH